MVLNGRIRNGRIILDQPQTLPEGSRVRVEIIESTVGQATSNFRSLFGSISVGPPNGSDNDSIDADLSREYADEA